MALKSTVERCFKEILDAALVTGGTSGRQALPSQHNQTITFCGQDVTIRDMGGPQVSPKARNLRRRVEIVVRTVADYQEGDEFTPEAIHAANVDAVRAALDDQPTPLRDLLNAARDALELPFTCFGIVPLGEIEVKKAADDRAFYDGWAYRVDCAEYTST